MTVDECVIDGNGVLEGANGSDLEFRGPSETRFLCRSSICSVVSEVLQTIQSSFRNIT